jgi:hypothetical protein
MEGVNDMQELEKTQSNPHETASRLVITRSSQGPPGTLSAAMTRTHQSNDVTFGKTMTDVNVRDCNTYDGEKGGLVFVVGYQGENDPITPHNWEVGIRVLSTVIIASIGFVVGVASSID